ncbi:unnamed protein product [Dicrocoelium dendriticum]|nr:unnamed protein product [Dicrocoelium dendriticum]
MQAKEVLSSTTEKVIKINLEDVEAMIQKNLDKILNNEFYTQEKAPQLARTLIETCLDSLVKMGKPYKYVVNCTVVQKCGGGLFHGSSCYWDTARDSTCTVRWENKTMHCVMTVFSIAL